VERDKSLINGILLVIFINYLEKTYTKKIQLDIFIFSILVSTVE